MASGLAGSTTPTGTMNPGSGSPAMPNVAAPPPPWARQLQRKQQVGQAASTIAHTLRGGDAGGSASGPHLNDSPEA